MHGMQTCVDCAHGPSGQAREAAVREQGTLLPLRIAVSKNCVIICELTVVEFDMFMDSDLDLIFE